MVWQWHLILAKGGEAIAFRIRGRHMHRDAFFQSE